MDRYPADLRHEECKRWDYSPELPAVSVVLVFHNEGWATLVRTIHSVINFTPKELLEEVVLIDDGRKRIKIDIFDRNIYGLFFFFNLLIFLRVAPPAIFEISIYGS